MADAAAERANAFAMPDGVEMIIVFQRVSTAMKILQRLLATATKHALLTRHVMAMAVVLEGWENANALQAGAERTAASQ